MTRTAIGLPPPTISGPNDMENVTKGLWKEASRAGGMTTTASATGLALVITETTEIVVKEGMCAAMTESAMERQGAMTCPKVVVGGVAVQDARPVACAEGIVLYCF